MDYDSTADVPGNNDLPADEAGKDDLATEDQKLNNVVESMTKGLQIMNYVVKNEDKAPGNGFVVEEAKNQGFMTVIPAFTSNKDFMKGATGQSFKGQVEDLLSLFPALSSNKDFMKGATGQSFKGQVKDWLSLVEKILNEVMDFANTNSATLINT